ncbi:hypothetical protein [Sandaracinus amylolyticus]|uniref:hypothetical protein n=1 Tax=Sandaracinus amylolyticus TaxID=927083 RepID=UPI00069CCB00|nr:hypothetical protein [Sandaracinus amylolyticus]
MRPALAVALLLLAACSSPDPAPPVCAPGESRACICSGGASGEQVCDDEGESLGPCECGVMDGGGGAVNDAGALDAGPEIDASARDAGVDGARPDAGRDGGRDSGPPPECNVVPQSGCDTGDACRLSEVGGRSPGIGPPECVPSGPQREDETCDDDSDCRAGLFCVTVCRRYCVPGGVACPDVEGSAYHCDTTTLLAGNSLGLGHCQFTPP